MIRWLTQLTVVAILVAGCRQGEAPNRVLDEAQQLINSGQAARAIEALRLQRIDYPWSNALLFQLASAQSAAAEAREEPGSAAAAEELLREAHMNFLRSMERSSTAYGDSASYNAATALLRLDTALENTDRYEDRVANLREAIALLAGLPELSEGRHNLDYARYRLARLLQNPPRDDEDDSSNEDEDPPPSGSAVEAVTTQIPQATAEVVDGNTIVLHLPPREEGGT